MLVTPLGFSVRKPRRNPLEFGRTNCEQTGNKLGIVSFLLFGFFFLLSLLDPIVCYSVMYVIRFLCLSLFLFSGVCWISLDFLLKTGGWRSVANLMLIDSALRDKVESS